MVTRQQVLETQKKIFEIDTMLSKMKRICEIALLQYDVGGQLKTLPQADIYALIEDYKALKVELKRKADELP